MRTLFMVSALVPMVMAGTATAADKRDASGTGAVDGSSRATSEDFRARDRASLGRAASLDGRPRWGGQIQGQWWAGDKAPGGWRAYDRPILGAILRGYWISPEWRIDDWSSFGLPQPEAGQRWSRYYNDAVLIDSQGSVLDTIGGVDWDQHDPEGTDYAYHDDGKQHVGHRAPSAPGASYARPLIPGGDISGARLKKAGADRAARVSSPLTSTPTSPSSAATKVAVLAPGAAYPRPAAKAYPQALATRAPSPTNLTNAAPSFASPTPAAKPTAGDGYPRAVATRAPFTPSVASPVVWPQDGTVETWSPVAPDKLPSQVVSVQGADGASVPPVVVRAGPGTRIVPDSEPIATEGYYADGYYYPAPTITTITIDHQGTGTTTYRVAEDGLTHSGQAR